MIATVVLLLASAAPKPALAAFPDVQGHWGQAVIERMASLGVIKGYEDGTFRPDGAVSREEAVTMVARLFPDFVDKPKEQYLTSYVDIDDRWSSDHLHAVIKAGLMRGFPDFTFRPEDPMLRRDAAMLVCKARFYTLPLSDAYYLSQYPGPFMFLPEHTRESELLVRQSFYDEAVYVTTRGEDYPSRDLYPPLAVLLDFKVIQGYPDGSMRWNQDLTRAEFSAILARTLDIVETTYRRSGSGVSYPRSGFWVPAGDIDSAKALETAGAYFKKAYPDPYQRARAIYDTMHFNYSYLTNPTPPNAYSAVRVGGGICGHLSSIYTVVAQKAGLDATRVTGPVHDAVEDRGQHAWVQIALEDRTFLLDPTFGLTRVKVFFDNLDEWTESGYKWTPEGYQKEIRLW